MGLRVLLVRVVQVVGRQQRDAEVLGDGQQRRLGLLLDRQAVVHQLGVEVLLAEDVLEVGGRLAGPVLLAGPQPHVDLAGRAAGGGDEARPVALEQVTVEARLAVLPLEAGQRGDPEEVVHALGGAGQQRHVRVRGLAAVGPAVALLVDQVVAEVERRAVEPRAGRVVALHADDRLHARPWSPACRSRRRRRRCRGRSSPARASPARQRPPSPRAAWPRRRASSTRCARAGARTNRTGAAHGCWCSSVVVRARRRRNAGGRPAGKTGGSCARCSLEGRRTGCPILALPRSTPRV